MSVLLVVLVGLYLVTVVGYYKQALPVWADAFLVEELPRVLRVVCGFVSIFWPVSLVSHLIKVAIRGT